MTNSQNGYPVFTKSSSPFLHKWLVPGTGRYFLIRDGSCGFLLAMTALFFHDKVERLDLGTWDDWGWAYRPIRGATTLSNHASGTALDLNSTRHPLGVPAHQTYTPKQVASIHSWLDRLNDCVRWGGDYTGRPDGMHFEINKSLSEVERTARRFLTTRRGTLILSANPGQKAVILS